MRVRPGVPYTHRDQGMGPGPVPVHPAAQPLHLAPGHQDLQRVQGTGRRDGPVALRAGDPLCGPEELGEVWEGKGPVRVLADGPAGLEGCLHRQTPRGVRRRKDHLTAGENHW